MRGLSILVLVGYMVSTRFPQQNSLETLDPALRQVVVWVTDSSGRPVQDLSAEDFLLEANGVPQTIASFHRNPERAVSIAVLIDGGPGTVRDGSIFRELGAARIFRRFFMKKGDEIALVTSLPYEIYDGMSDFLEFDRLLNDQLAYSEAYRSFTPEKLARLPKFGDSMIKALSGVTRMKHQSRALIVFSSQGRSLDLKDDLAEIRSAEIPVFIVNFSNTITEIRGMERGAQFEILPLDLEAGNNRGTLAFEKDLTRIVEETNGLSEYFTFDQSRPVERITEFAQRVSIALRGQYLLSYDASKLSDSSMSSIRVRLSGAPRQYSLRIRPVPAN